jgi:protein required for attachment to host cells
MKTTSINARKAPTVWVLVADGKQASIYQLGKAEKVIPLPGNAKHPHYETSAALELSEVAGMHWQAQSAEEYQVGRNATGMVFESAGGARHMSAPHVDVRREVKEHFATMVAGEVNSARAKKSFDQIIVIAPPLILGVLREHFDKDTRNAIKAELQKELVNLSPSELMPHLQKALSSGI